MRLDDRTHDGQPESDARTVGPGRVRADESLEHPGQQISVDAGPVVLSGQNFALSPDGRELAVLDGSTIGLYDLPEMSLEERAKFTAVKADVPGLYAPPAQAATSEPCEPPASP